MEENNIYETEISPKEIFELMKANIYDKYFGHLGSAINEDYLSSRSSLLNLIHKISNKLGFSSRTFFLGAYYLDIIFTKKKKIECNSNTLAVACLALSAKYCENDPVVPQLQYFIRVYTNILGFKNNISILDLRYAEVLACKALNYKLNYFTSYDFDSFFFGHGIIKLEQLREINSTYIKFSGNDFVINATNSLFIKKILEKIYKKSRHYLDTIVNNSKLCLKYNSLFLSVFTMKKSIEEVLLEENKNKNKNDPKFKANFHKKSEKCFKEIMYDFYRISYENNPQYKELINDSEIIEIFQDQRKGDLGPVTCLEKNQIANKIQKIDENGVKKSLNNIFNPSNIKGNQTQNNSESKESAKNNNKKYNFRKKNKVPTNQAEEKEQKENQKNNDINEKLMINKSQKDNMNNEENLNINENLNIDEITKINDEKDNNGRNRKTKSIFNSNQRNQNKFTNTICSKKIISSKNEFDNDDYEKRKNKIKISITKDNDDESSVKFEQATLNNNFSNYRRLNQYWRKRKNDDNIEGQNYSCNAKNSNSISIANEISQDNMTFKNDNKPYFRKVVQANNDASSSCQTSISRPSNVYPHAIENKRKYESIGFNSTNTSNTVNTIQNPSNTITTRNFYSRMRLRRNEQANISLPNNQEDSLLHNSINVIEMAKSRTKNKVEDNNNRELSIKDTTSRVIEDYNQGGYKLGTGSSYFSRRRNFNNDSRYSNQNSSFKIEGAKFSNGVLNAKTSYKPNENPKRISYLLSQKSNDLNDKLKEINKAYNVNEGSSRKFEKTFLNSKNDKKEENTRLNNMTLELENAKKKLTNCKFQSIRHKYMNNRNNTSADIDNSEQEITSKSTDKINNENNRNINDKNNDNKKLSSIKGNESSQVSRFKNIATSSIYRLLNKTKNLYEKATGDINKDEEYSNTHSGGFFYGTHNNFNKQNKDNTKEITSTNERRNTKEKSSIMNTINSSSCNNVNENGISKTTLYYRNFLRNRINKGNKENKDTRDGKETTGGQGQKNPSTIVINNNININFGNKTNNISSEYIKYKSVFKRNGTDINSNNNSKSNITNSNCNIINKSSNNTINNSSSGHTFSSLLHKLPFYRRANESNNASFKEEKKNFLKK